MIEFYVFSVIAGLGLMLNRKRAAAQELTPSNIGPKLPPKPKLTASGMPSQNNIYDADYVRRARNQEREAVRTAFNAAKNPKETGVIPRTVGGADPITKTYADYHGPTMYRSQNPAAPPQPTMVESPLTGMKFPIEKFHNNMTPFFGSTVTQNMDHNQATLSLDLRQGVFNRDAAPKREIAPMFQPQKDVSNVHGMPNHVGFLQDRIVKPTARNNEFPIPRQHVGPGIGNYGSQPQADVYIKQRKYVKPKTVDELRTTSNPKTTGLEGRVVAGQEKKERGLFPSFHKNRPYTTVKRRPQDNFTMAATKKQTRRPDVLYAKPTKRPETQVPYAGVAKLAQGGRPTSRERPSHEPFRQMLAGPHFQPGNLTQQGRGAKYDYGKGSIQVYANERDLTATRTHQGNVTSLVKAIVAPFQDAARIAKKEFMVEAKENDVGVRPQIPSKPTVYNPDAPAKTTVKETTLHDTHGKAALRNAAFKAPVYDPDAVAKTTIRETTEAGLRHGSGAFKGGALKTAVYDPDAVARTTTKETTLAEPPRANVGRTAQKGAVYDPDATARTTTKETTLAETVPANVRRVARKGTTYDPEAVARTTTKETTLSEALPANVRRVAQKNTVYDPEAMAKTTTKETTLFDATGKANIDSGERRPTAREPCTRARTTGKETVEEHIAAQRSRNVHGGKKAGTVKDPDDVAKTTVKETLVQPDREGNVQSLEGRKGGYLAANYEAPHTQKEVLHREYEGPANTGSVEGGGGGGYRVANPHAKETQKQTLSQKPYYGTAAEQGPKAPPSYEDVMNAMMNETRELVLAGREPTQTGVKVPPGPDSVNLVYRGNELPNDADERMERNISAHVPGPHTVTVEGDDDGGGAETEGRSGDDGAVDPRRLVCPPAEVTRERNVYDDAAQRLDVETMYALKSNPFVIKPLAEAASEGAVPFSAQNITDERPEDKEERNGDDTLNEAQDEEQDAGSDRIIVPPAIDGIREQNSQ